MAGQFIGQMGKKETNTVESGKKKREKLFVFDNKDNLLTVTTRYITAFFKEDTERPVSLTIEFPVEDDDSEFLVGGNQVAFRDLKGNFRLFTIRETDDIDEVTTEKIVECLPGMQELTDTMVEERRIQSRSADYALGVILENSPQWKKGNVAELGNNSLSIYFKNAYESLGELINIWGGEVVDRIEIDKNKIAGRYIDIVYRKGENNGKRFEVGKDIQSINRTVLYYPKTALYAKGSSVETEGGGNSRKITFRDVEWSKENGDPVDKPAGQEWVGDEEARKKHGIYNPDTGQMEHRFDLFEDNDEEEPNQLLRKTWLSVQDEKEPKAQYEMSIDTFYGIADYEHEQVFLGDTGIARDKSIKPIILVESRVLELEYDIGNPSEGDLLIGNILELDQDDTDIDWVVDKVKDDSGNWDAGGGPITDDRFPDVKPAIPNNFEAEGLFRAIVTSWEFNSTYNIANYEVYASQTNGFVPDESNLVYRGKTGGYTHQVETDERWYFRLRAVNPHGTASDYTEQINASTVQLNLPDLEDIIPDFMEYQIYEGAEEPHPDKYKYWLDKSKEPFILKRWDNGDWVPLSPDLEPINQQIFEIQEQADRIRTYIGEVEVKTDDNIDEIESVSQYASEIEQKANRIRTTLEELETDYDSFVQSTRSTFEQHSEWIASRVTSDYVEAELSNLDVEHRNLALGTGEEINSIFAMYSINASELIKLKGQKVSLSFDANLEVAGEGTVTIVSGSENIFTGYFQNDGSYQHYEFTFQLEDFTDEVGLNVMVLPTLKVRKLKLNKGEPQPWTPAPEDTSDLTARVVHAESEIVQQAELIETKVEKNEIISYIRQSPEAIKIQAERVELGNGDLVVQGGNVYIRNSVITNELIAADARIDGAKIANLDVDKITGNTSDFVRSMWNGITNSVQMSANGLSTYSGSYRTSLLSGIGHEFYRDGSSIGNIGTSSWNDMPSKKGLSFQLDYDADYMTWSHKESRSDTTFTTQLSWFKDSSIVGSSGFVFSDHIRIGNGNNLYLRTLATLGARTINGYEGRRHVQLRNFTWDDASGVAFTRGANAGGASLFISGNRAALLTPLGNDGYIEVTGDAVRSLAVYNRTYSSTSQQMRVTVNGVFGRSTSSRRYKVNEEVISLEYARRIFGLDATSWFDKRAVEDYCNTLEYGTETEVQRIERIGGVIAEDVHDVGLGMYVSYDDKGRPDGLHDTLWTTLIPITRDHDERITDLEVENKLLKERIKQLEGAA